MNHKAIFETHPHVKQIVGDTAYELVDGEFVETSLDTDAVAAKEAEYAAAWAASEYQRQRAEEYPPITDQLDMIYHAGQGGDAFQAAIRAVKDKYPKP